VGCGWVVRTWTSPRFLLLQVRVGHVVRRGVRKIKAEDVCRVRCFVNPSGTKIFGIWFATLAAACELVSFPLVREVELDQIDEGSDETMGAMKQCVQGGRLTEQLVGGMVLEQTARKGLTTLGGFFFFSALPHPNTLRPRTREN
jgi:hypothetical protein